MQLVTRSKDILWMLHMVIVLGYVLFDMNETQKRSSNQMLFNQPENEEKNDLQVAKNLILRLTDKPVNVVSASRNVKSNKNGYRSLGLQSPDDIRLVFMNKKKTGQK